MPTLLGKFVRCLTGEELPFLWETESLKEQDDADAQETPLGGSHGAVGVNALFNPRRITFSGKFLMSPGGWLASRAYNIGEVVTPGAYMYQAQTTGVASAGPVTWGAAIVQDGGVTWGKRTALYDCVRWLKDQFDSYFHCGILKLYLDDDRYHFAQCIARGFAPGDNTDTSVDWDATFTCADPRRYGETLNSLTHAVAATAPMWAALTTYAANATAFLPGDNGRKYKATVAGKSSPNAPSGPFTAAVWRPFTVYALGDVVRPVVGTGKTYTCTRAGTSGANAPGFPATGAVNDPDAGGCQWTASDTFYDDNVPVWASGRLYGLTDVIRLAAHNGWTYACTRAGTSGAIIPVLPTVENATINDPDAGGCQWTAHKAAVWQYDGQAAAGTYSTVFTYAGNADGDPYITLAVPACSLNVQITNVNTGQFCTLNGEVNAGDVVLDCTGGTVTAAGWEAMALFDGEFPGLTAGTNEIRVDWVDPGPTNISIDYRERWW